MPEGGAENPREGSPDDPDTERGPGDGQFHFLPNARTGWIFLAGLVLLSVSLALAPGPDVSLRYYELVAQILPVFWIVVALESRVFRLHPELGPDRGVVVLSYVMLVAGEIGSLVAVATECSSNLLLLLTTVISLGTAFAWITGAALFGWPRHENGSDPEAR